jgi:hypothetical protein
LEIGRQTLSFERASDEEYVGVAVFYHDYRGFGPAIAEIRPGL